MKKKIGFLLCCIIISLTIAKTPDGLAVGYYDNLMQGNWDELGEFYTDESLEEFRELFSVILEIPDEDYQKEIVEMFFGEKATVKSVKKLSNKDFFGGLMKGIYELIGKYALMNYDTVDVIGSVQETDDLVHVVSRCVIKIEITDVEDLDFAPMNLETMEVLSFEKVKGKWKMLLDSKIRGLAQQIRNVMNQ